MENYKIDARKKTLFKYCNQTRPYESKKKRKKPVNPSMLPYTFQKLVYCIINRTAYAIFTYMI